MPRVAPSTDYSRSRLDQIRRSTLSATHDRLGLVTRPMTMGVIVGNRGFFPDHLAKEGREEIIKALTSSGIEPLVLSPEDSKYGAVETRAESRKCADLFRSEER